MHIWPGLFVGPLVLLSEESLAYALVPWVCAAGQHAALHAVKAVALLVVLAATAYAWYGWRLAGAGVPDDGGSETTRTRFLTLIGIGLSALSALAIAAEWLTTFAIPPCVR